MPCRAPLVVGLELVKAQEGLAPARTGVWLYLCLGTWGTVSGELESLGGSSRLSSWGLNCMPLTCACIWVPVKLPWMPKQHRGASRGQRCIAPAKMDVPLPQPTCSQPPGGSALPGLTLCTVTSLNPLGTGFQPQRSCNLDDICDSRTNGAKISFERDTRIYISIFL